MYGACVEQVGRIQVIAFQSQDGRRRDAQHFKAQGGSATNLAGMETNRAAPVAPVPCSSDTEIPGTLASGKVRFRRRNFSSCVLCVNNLNEMDLQVLHLKIICAISLAIEALGFLVRLGRGHHQPANSKLQRLKACLQLQIARQAVLLRLPLPKMNL